MEIDCRTREGIVIGLIDSIISISRVLKPMLLRSNHTKDGISTPNYLMPNIEEALKDLHQDEDLLAILQLGPFNPRIQSEEDRRILGLIDSTTKLLKEKGIPIKM